METDGTHVACYPERSNVVTTMSCIQIFISLELEVDYTLPVEVGDILGCGEGMGDSVGTVGLDGEGDGSAEG